MAGYIRKIIANICRNSTRSLYDSDIVYYDLYGRRYCADYYMPNDEDEQTRLQILHTVYLHMLDNELTTAPLHNPTHILDIGTGTGEWAMAIADQYPDCEVIGTDIAKIQPSAVPPNVFFEIDDAEEEGVWTWPEDEFDLVHIRGLAGAFTDWKAMYREAWRHCKPGGWVEICDYDNHDAFMAYFSHDVDVRRWLSAINEASFKSGRPRGADHLDPDWLREVGFTDVKKKVLAIPMGVWPDDEAERKIGSHFLISMLCGIEALCLRPMVESLGMELDEVKRLSENVASVVKKVALDREAGKGLAFRMEIVIARKPERGEVVRGVLQGGSRGNLSTEEVEDWSGGVEESWGGGRGEMEWEREREVSGGGTGFLEVGDGNSTVGGSSVTTIMGNGGTSHGQ